MGLACRYSIGRILEPEEFSGGEAPGQANFVLRQLGFSVVKKSQDSTNPRSERLVRTGSPADRCRLFRHARGPRCWAASTRNQKHRKALIPQLSGRSDGSIEFKHQNVSGVLVDLDCRTSRGTSPAAITSRCSPRKSRRSSMIDLASCRNWLQPCLESDGTSVGQHARHRPDYRRNRRSGSLFPR